MGHFGEHFGGNYDVKKYKKKLSDELPWRYTHYDVKKKVANAERYYKKGQMIEAFALLYAVLEQYLIQIFRIKLQLDLKLKPWDEINLKHEWGYAQLIRVLNENNVLADNEYQKFNLFQDGRHKAVHQLPLPHLHKKISKINLDNSFNAGMKAYEISHSKLQSMIHESVSKADLSNNIGEVMHYLEKMKRERQQKK